jgi:hypothetical protein
MLTSFVEEGKHRCILTYVLASLFYHLYWSCLCIYVLVVAWNSRCIKLSFPVILVWQNHLGEGFVIRINLSDSRWSENTINTHKYNTIYWSSSRSYYNLSSRINYTEEVWSQNYASKDKSEFIEAISLNGQNILFALKENVIHQYSKPEDPSTESNPLRFGLPTDNPRRHRRQEEAVSHLHAKDSKSKAWATTLSKTYPRWPKDYL